MADTLISVRGEARQYVPPDAAELRANLTATDLSKPAALGSVGDAVRGLTAALEAIGGAARTVDSTRAALTWSTESVQTSPEWDPTSGNETGRTVASASLVVAVRHFALLDAVGDALARTDAAQLQYVSWSVDADNAAWPAVRASAVQDALTKGRDYAEALGGRLAGIEHVADSGLLGDTGGGGPIRFARAAAAKGGDDGAPSLDPVPQELLATVEARFRADVAELS